MRWIRGLGAAVALLLILAGAPLALAWWGRPPSGWPALARPDDGTVLLGVLTVLGWLAWAAFTLSVTLEAARLVSSGRVRVRLPLLGGLQQVTAGLLLAILTLAPGDSVQAELPIATRPESAPPGQPAGLGDQAGLKDQAPPSQGGYVVTEGDDLWSVSERLLGDGQRWRELAALNPVELADPARPLTSGARLTVPAAAAAAEATYVRVQRGDTLSGLALEHLGWAARWPRIAAANTRLVTDPDHIEIGWRLRIPGAEQAAGRTSPDREGPGTARPKPTEAPAPATPAPATPAPVPQVPVPPAAATPAAEPDQPTDDLELAPLLGTLGTLAAAAILGAVEARRYLRLRDRPVGRRLLPPEEQAARLRSAIGRRQRPDRLAALDTALRSIGGHCFSTGSPLPELDRVVVGPDSIRFQWADRPDGQPPAGFGVDGSCWTVSLDDFGLPPVSDHPCPFPALVSLGSTEHDELLLVDAERSRVLGVSAPDPGLVAASLASMGVELGCASWAQELHLVVTGEGSDLIRLAGGERVTWQARLEDAIAQLHLVVEQRRAALAEARLARLRVDPDRAEAVAPVVLLILDELPAGRVAELDELLGGPPVGVAVILAVPADSRAQWSVTGLTNAPVGRLAGVPGELIAHAIPESTRAGIAALLRNADDPATTPAPWWGGAPPANVVTMPSARRGDEPVDVVRLVRPAVFPQVLLIGPTELAGAAGPEPSRSRQQLVELCAWLLEHPGSTATAMAAGLAVAEGTRRSNLSRLRAWLGTGPDGQPYLPDAYSGRVLLHPGVTSDWQRVQLLLAPGIDRVGDQSLLAALELVRGAPLADAAPGQWHWAEELRTDIACALRDAGLVLTDRALARGDVDLARWAAARALVVAPEDELLLGARIRTEHRAGNSKDVERLVNQVTRQARMLGVDLLPETVELCQQVIEGRVRARHA